MEIESLFEEVGKHHSQLSPADAFACLWVKALARGILIHVGPIGIRQHERGTFYVTENGRPHIHLKRKHQHEVEGVVEELFTLAHEYGHFLSHCDGNRTAEYVAAVDALRAGDKLAAEQAALTYDEERRAWDHARAELKRLRLDARYWGFDKHADDALAIYRAVLKLDAA